MLKLIYHKITTIITSLSIILLFTITKFNAQTQTKTKLNYVEVKGTIYKGKKILDGVIVNLYCDNLLQKSIGTKSGKFTLPLDFQKTYILEFSKPEYVSQKYEITTKNIPKKLIDDGLWPFEIEVNLFEAFEGLDASIYTKNAAKKYYFSPEDEDFVEDKTYYNNNKSKFDAVQKQLTTLIKQKYDKTITEAEKYVQTKNFEEALITFKKAQEILPSESTPTKRIKEVQKLAGATETAEQAFIRYIQKGTDALTSKKLDEAEKYFNLASLYKPDDPTPPIKLAEIQEIRDNEIVEKKIRYNNIIIEAEKKFAEKDYEESYIKFKEAIKIFPTETYPKIKIEEIKKVSSEETMYNNNITKAKSLLSEHKYDNAIHAFEKALEFKPSETYPKTKIQEIQTLKEKSIEPKTEEKKETKLEEQKTEPKKEKTTLEINLKDEEYKQAIKDGDLYFKNKKYAIARDVFTRATELKPNEKYPKEKIQAIDKLLAEQAQKTKPETKITQNNTLIQKSLTTTNSETTQPKTQLSQTTTLTKANTPPPITPQPTINTNTQTTSTTENKITEQLAPTIITQPTTTSTQTKQIENYIQQLKTKEIENNKQAQIEIQNKLADAYIEQNNPEKAIEYLKKSLEVSKTINNKQEIPKIQSRIASLYHNNNDYAKALTYYSEALNQIKSEKNYEEVASILNNIAVVYLDSGNYQNAIDNYQEAITLKKQLNNKIGQAKLESELGAVYENMYRYSDALKYYENALKIKKEIKDTSSVNTLYNTIGQVYYEQGNIDKTIEYFDKALQNAKETKKETDIAAAYNNLGILYYEKGDYAKAIEYYNKSLEILIRNNNKKEMALTYNNIGNVNYDWEKYNEALLYYEKALKIKKELHYEKGVAVSYHNIGKVYVKKNELKKAIDYFVRSAQIAKQTMYNDLLYKNYKALSELYYQLQQYQKAYDYYKLFAQAKFNILSEEKDNPVSEFQTRTLNIKKDREINMLRGELRKQKLMAKIEADRRQKEIAIKDLQIKEAANRAKLQQIIISVTVVGLLAILIFAILIYRQYDQKKKANILLAQRNAEISKQRDEIKKQRNIAEQQRDLIAVQKKDITDSILYARRIQTAILPKKDILNNCLPTYFIFNKPRDIVSGDFYWFSQRKENIIVVASDCTGHGVPGAFMSMIGTCYLNEIINEKGITKPTSILQELRTYIIRALHQTGQEGEARDGMDMALCTFNMNTRTLQFAGANNPLYVIRNKQLIEIKADHMPIGIHMRADQPFTNHVLKLEKNDCIYLFSDGFADQFGGKNNKKFKYSQFKNLLLSIHHEPMNEQRLIIEKTLNEWKGNYEQVDDILIIGIKV